MPDNQINTILLDGTSPTLTPSSTIYPDDRAGTLAKINNLPSGASIDNIFYFLVNGDIYKRVIDGPLSARNCGIYPESGNQYDNFVAAFNAGVKTIVFDEPNGGTYYLDDIINPNPGPPTLPLNIPQGVVLQFYQGNKLSGTGTLNGGIIDADHQFHIFDIDLTVNPEAVRDDKFSVRWYGAKGNGSSPDHTFIQRSIDLVIRSLGVLKTVWFPNGYYRIDEPLIAYNWNGTAYSQVTIYLEGDGSFWPFSYTGPRIQATFNNSFAIGIQLGKGCRIKGLQILGKFTPPFSGATFEFFSCAFEDFKEDINKPGGPARDSQFSPYSGISIDPFGPRRIKRDELDESVNDMYPGLEHMYRGDSKSGSTGIVIEDVVINNFVVGICFSPNGITQNAELILITKYQFNSVKLAVSGGQDQEKMNKVQFAAGWVDVHTVFATSFYGAGTPGNWYIEDLNLAGNVNRLIYNNQGGYFPTYIKNVFAERIGTFGVMNSSVGAEVDSCEMAFALPIVTKMTQFNIESNGVKFSNCCFRHYGSSIPISIKGTAMFENVAFNATPYITADQSGQLGLPTFMNCTANTYRLGSTNTVSQIARHQSFIYASPYAPNGSYKTYDPIEYRNSRNGYLFSGDEINLVIALDRDPFVINIVGPERKFIINISPNKLHKVSVNCIVTTIISGMQQPIGVITDVMPTGEIEISYASKLLNNGSNYYLSTVHPLRCGISFIGDTVVSQPTIGNVRFADNFGTPDGQPTEDLLIDLWVKSPVHVADGDNTYTPYTRIIGWNPTSRTLTVSYHAYYSQTAAFFSNEGMQYFDLSNANSRSLSNPAKLLQKGALITLVNNILGSIQGKDGLKQTFRVTTSGYIDPGLAGDTRRAYFMPLDIAEFDQNPEGIISFPSGSMLRNTSTGDVYLKTQTDNTQINGGSIGWVKM